MKPAPVVAFLAALVGAACHRTDGAHDAAAERAGPSRPTPVAIQLPPTVDRWRPWATVVAGARPDLGVVLVHQLGSSRREWQPLVDRLARGPAVTTLALDLRGHGDSVRGPRDEDVRWESFGTDPARWMGAAYDVMTAVTYLRAQGATRVVVVGSSVGATAALLAATATLPPGAAPLLDPPEVHGLALVSPGLAYRGVDIREPMDVWLSRGRPLLLLAGELDGPSAEAVSVLAPARALNVRREVFAGAAEHGVALCNAAPDRWAALERWVRQTLDPAPPAPLVQPSGDAAVD
ncbi:MAG: alpha/beta fold hydrolase [Polyangiales bacterium]